MNTFQLIIEYDGTFFHGWQIQKKGERTVQDEIKKTIKMLLKEDVTLIGSGRTDQGVHALRQTAHFKTLAQIDCPKFCNALNALLPKDIAIIAIKKVSEKFHAQYCAKTKTYRYLILNRQTRPALIKNIVYHYPHPLNLKAMRQASKLLLGTKDFQALTAKTSLLKNKKGTVRSIKKITIKKSNDLITIDIEANGFLYKMARNIIGTLLTIGSEKIPVHSISTILKSGKRALAGPTAPARGLQLLNVKY